MDEETLEQSLGLYKTQLSQVQDALTASGSNDDLEKLQDDLKELIKLTEENLLSLKKSRLLALLDKQVNDGASTSTCQPQESPVTHFSTAVESSDSDDDSSPDDAALQNTDDTFAEMIGCKVRAPHSHDWGCHAYHNAMVISVNSSSDSPEADILFINPTHRSMVPCQHFLNNTCRYEDNCRYSHGYKVAIDELQEYKEPDLSCLKLESKCLAKWTDSVWYKAMVVEVFPEMSFKVMFEQGDDVLTVPATDIIPYSMSEGESSPSSSEDDENDDGDDVHASDSDSDELPVYLWRPNQTTDKLGDWEQFTKGIGSKLMERMGYIHGQGLGKENQGKATPVPIQLLPVGKSLDRIMQLKEIAGDRDLYDVMKQQEKKKKHKKTKTEKKTQPSTSADMFNFINNKLKAKKGNKHGHKSAATSKEISEHDLKKKSDKSLNVQLFKTHEEIKSTEKEISRLKVSLGRNEGRDSPMSKQILAKIQSLEQYITKLRQSERSIQKHQSHRNNHKKLTVF